MSDYLREILYDGKIKNQFTLTINPFANYTINIIRKYEDYKKQQNVVADDETLELEEDKIEISQQVQDLIEKYYEKEQNITITLNSYHYKKYNINPHDDKAIEQAMKKEKKEARQFLRKELFKKLDEYSLTILFNLKDELIFAAEVDKKIAKYNLNDIDCKKLREEGCISPKKFDLRKYLFKREWGKATTDFKKDVIQRNIVLRDPNNMDEDFAKENALDNEYWNKSNVFYNFFLNPIIFSCLSEEFKRVNNIDYKVNDNTLYGIISSLNFTEIHEMLSNYSLPGILTNEAPKESDIIITTQSNHNFHFKSLYLIVNEEEYKKRIEPVINIYRVFENYIKAYKNDVEHKNLDSRVEILSATSKLMEVFQSQEYQDMPKEWLIPEYQQIDQQMSQHRNQIASKNHSLSQSHSFEMQ